MHRTLLLTLFLTSSACGTDNKPSRAIDAVDVTTATDTSNATCDAPGLVWHSGNKTTYTSYPTPGSEECIEFSGCEYQGQFSECANTMPEAWVRDHDIVAVFPLGNLGLHDLCLRAGAKTLVVTALDTCADSDCDGCCGQNRGSAAALIDIESYTNQRFGLDDGPLEWADLGPHPNPSLDGCN